MIKEHNQVVLRSPIRNAGLEAGDVGTVVHVHGEGAAYEVEFTTLAGETIAVVTVKADDVRSVSNRDIAHTREMSAA